MTISRVFVPRASTNVANWISDPQPLIGVMYGGRVVEFGPPAAIMTDDVLSRVFDTPVQVVDGPSGPLAVYY